MKNVELRQQVVSCMTVIAMLINEFGKETPDGGKEVMIKRADMDKLIGYDVTTEKVEEDLVVRLVPKGGSMDGRSSSGSNSSN